MNFKSKSQKIMYP